MDPIPGRFGFPNQCNARFGKELFVCCKVGKVQHFGSLSEGVEALQGVFLSVPVQKSFFQTVCEASAVVYSRGVRFSYGGLDPKSRGAGEPVV